MELMSVKAYAESRNLAVSTVRSLCKANVLPSVKIGVGWRIDVLGADEVFRAKMSARTTPIKVTPEKLPSITNRGKNKGNFLERLKAL